MAAEIQKEIRHEDENKLTLPVGWSVPVELNNAVLNEDGSDVDLNSKSVVHNLPLAAERVEQLIDTLQERLSIAVPISYLRIDGTTSFRVLLLINTVDYMSPKIHAARILARGFRHDEDTFDIHFVFTVKSENMMADAILSKGYKLMHIRDEEQNAA